MNGNFEVEVIINKENKDKKQIKDGSFLETYILEEGENLIEINIYINGFIEIQKSQKIYVVQKYQKQFLDEISSKGIQVHYRDGTKEVYDKSSKLLKSLGVNYIRADFLQDSIEKKLGIYNFSEYDKWVNDITETTNMKILAIINGIQRYSGSDKLINTDEEIEIYNNFFLEVMKHYPQIRDYQILNEVNLYSSTYKGAYFNENDMKWYSKLLKKIYENDECQKVNIIVAGTTTPKEDQKDRITSEKFYQYFYNTKGTNYCNNLAFHPYAINNLNYTRSKINSHKSLFNIFGGFFNINVTEYGSTIYWVSEEIQAEDLLKQTIALDSEAKLLILYNLWTTGDEKSYEQFGILRNDYTPRPAYYAMKNYYENTNGAEYIGMVNIADGLEAHVYDKDGKPVIITWSEDSTNNIQIDYKDFTAKDLYGKDIQPDENGKLTITASPVYLYDVDYNYFYKAISNVATSKYDEFKEKFATEISQISGFEEKINQRQNYSQSVANTQKLMQNTAITAMKSHYELGDIILKAYEEGQLKAEPVKISSMLDMINDIGNSYEDLVTVSVNNTINSVMKTLDEANVDSSELVTIKQKIDETENLINTNTDVEIIYPTKILQFSKECYEKADYINSLEEQNDIKVGLIISNNLHAQLLADWANKFASIQINNNINDYIAQNPVTIEYSETNITNKSVKATIKTNAEIQITNNSNSKEYVFNQNGSFTFEYTIKGQAKQITAKVTNIDKTSPIINGVVDGKLYTSKVTPTITDENLDTIKLILNGEEVKNFKSGTTLTDEGFYTLTVTDKAGNQTQISFQIMENNNQNYIIKDDIIKNISEQTIKSDFDNKLKLGITYKITRNEKEISNTDNIATGDILTTSVGDKYTLIVSGDINKDGKVDLKDLIKIRKSILNDSNLEVNEALAADCNSDGKINLKDLVKIRLMILNKESEIK